MATVGLYRRDGLYVDGSLDARGVLTITGQDLSRTVHGGEYEYSLTVQPDDVPKVIAALGGRPGDDVLELLKAHAEDVVRAGEKTWLDSLGIEPGFWSWIGS